MADFCRIIELFRNQIHKMSCLKVLIVILLATTVFAQMTNPRGDHHHSHEYYSHERHHHVPERCRITRETSQQPYGAICLPHPTTYYYYNARADECQSETNLNTCKLPYQFICIHDCEHYCQRRH